jgi:23S rRNA (uracil1939-C5)-methyltransferase
MSKKSKAPVIVSNVEILDLGAEGKSVAKVDDKVLFVKNAVPGDVVDIRITKSKKSFAEAEAIHWHQFSDKRQVPECKHFGVCGGCTRQDLNYRWQLFYKQKQVKDNFERLGKFEFPELLPIMGCESDFYYRNKLEFAFSAQRWLTFEELNSGVEFEDKTALGFHIPGKFDKILDIEACFLQSDLSNHIRLKIREIARREKFSFFNLRSREGWLRNLIIRNNLREEYMVILVVTQNNPDEIQLILNEILAEFPQIVSLNYVINNKRNDTIFDLDVICFKGLPYLTEIMGNLQFRISPKSFFQTNSKQGLKLYEVTKQFAGLTGNEIVYDLYTGTGTIACFVSDCAKEVIGIEYIEDAIADAKTNAELNNITNARFYAGDMKDLLNEEFITQNGRPDVIIADPPRAGMHENVIQTLLFAAPEKIVYVSCNPATQARDISLLANAYRVEKVQPVDMFPHTHHIENVALLIRK